MKTVCKTKDGVDVVVVGDEDGGSGICQLVLTDPVVARVVLMIEEGMDLRIFPIPTEGIPTYGVGPR